MCVETAALNVNQPNRRKATRKHNSTMAHKADDDININNIIN